MPPKSNFNQVLFSPENLKEWLLYDLKRLGIVHNSEDFKLEIKPYSSTCYGRYYVKSDKIVVYMYMEKSQLIPYSYKSLLLTALHEAIHWKQHHDPNFVRYKGVMHNEEFYMNYGAYKSKALSILFKREVIMNAKRLSCTGNNPKENRIIPFSQ